MAFWNWFFKSKKVQCPRCLGKGNVDSEDIRRLNKEPYWMPGKCALCLGNGKVASKVAESGIADLGYLTLETPKDERRRLLNADEGAIQRAKQHQANMDDLVKKIESMFYIENLEASEIAEYLFKEYGRAEYAPEEKNELIRYIENVINSKLSKE
jgi:hypothetical protein